MTYSRGIWNIYGIGGVYAILWNIEYYGIWEVTQTNYETVVLVQKQCIYSRLAICIGKMTVSKHRNLGHSAAGLSENWTPQDPMSGHAT
jgi:hypothetical protein